MRRQAISIEDRLHSMAEILKRRDNADHARNLVMECMIIEEIEDNALMTRFHDFFLQISISELHPLIIFCFARPILGGFEEGNAYINDLNLKSIYGSHCVNKQANCYIYRATYWLDIPLNKERLSEILDRFSDEAQRGYLTITAI